MWERFPIRLLSTDLSPELAEVNRSTLSHSTLGSRPKGTSQATAKSTAAAGIHSPYILFNGYLVFVNYQV